MQLNVCMSQDIVKEKTIDDISQELQDAIKSSNHCLTGDLYFQRATQMLDLSLDADLILEDLDYSGIYFKRYCMDTVSYYRTKLVHAEVFLVNESNTDFAISETKEALDFFTIEKNLPLAGQALTLLSKLHAEKTDYEIAEKYVKSALDISNRINDTLLIIKNRLLGSRLTSLSGEPAIAIASNLIDFKLSCHFNDDILTSQICLALARDYLKIGNPDNAQFYLDYANSIEINDSKLEADILKELSLVYSAKENYSEAYAYATKYSLKREEIRNIEKEADEALNNVVEESNIEDLETRVNKLVETNDQLGNRVTNSTRLSATLGIAILASLFGLFYISRVYNRRIKVSEIISNQREEINTQRIIKLENDMKIQSLSSMVAGQEAERNRIATDLHDSLGGSLSALKLQFENVVMGDKRNGSDPFKNISVLIDNACSEVREIARNLKPSALENIGLVAAIRDLINRYNNHSDLDMSLHTDVDELELDYDSKLNLYRIFQELLNNVIKHADASEVDVQLTRTETDLILKVEDDGKGFNIDSVRKGLGLDSIQSRVNVLSGDLNIDSSDNRGTSVVIHIPINSSVLASTS